jgi:putative ABC transport system substrate-binding protein
VSSTSELFPYRQLIVELAEKSALPGIYAWRDYVEVGGLMAYGPDLVELWRRLANEVHEILNGAKPDDIPIYQPTKFEFLINLNRQGNRPYDSAHAARDRRRGDRVSEDRIHLLRYAKRFS